MNNITIASTMCEISAAWAVYMLYDSATAHVKYVGCCRLTELFNVPDARANVLFDEVFGPDKSLILRMINMHDDKNKAMSAQRKLIHEYSVPEMNQVSSLTRHAKIECINTGEVFDNAAHVCRAHGLPQPALSNHLNNKSGYNTVKGRTYRRMMK